MKNLIEELNGCQESKHPYFSYLIALINNIGSKDIDILIKIFDNARISGKRIFFIGNGGSASTAMHFANDLRSIPGLKPQFKSISLVDNMASITAIANDYGYEHIFVRQLECLFEKEDVLVGISASGNSKNIINAIEYANKKGGVTVGLVGFDGGIAKGLARHSIHIKTEQGAYGPVEDTHLALNHMITSHFYAQGQENIRTT